MPVLVETVLATTRLRRTQVVWAVFLVAISAVVLVHSFVRGDGHGGFLMAANLELLEVAAVDDPVFNLNVDLAGDRWTSIVIHHLGLPSGDAASVDRYHRSLGYQGLGYHFLIGNGSGLGDGIVHVGHRWANQLPGAHATGPEAAYFNERGIAICLIGNGDRRPFTERQSEALASLIRRLQRALAIPGDQVLLHRDIAPDITCPGNFFEAAALYEQLGR